MGQAQGRQVHALVRAGGWWLIAKLTSPPATQPPSPPAHQPTSPRAHQPTSPPAHQPTSPPAHQSPPAPMPQALALAITQVPLSLMDSLLFSGVTYFMVSAAWPQAASGGCWMQCIHTPGFRCPLHLASVWFRVPHGPDRLATAAGQWSGAWRATAAMMLGTDSCLPVA